MDWVEKWIREWRWEVEKLEGETETKGKKEKIWVLVRSRLIN